MPDTDTDTFQSGIAALQDATDSFDPDGGPWTVHGVALTPSITHGGSGVARFWPEDALRDAADRGLLEGRPIVKNYHDLDGQAPADDVIGEVSETEYAEGIGLVYEGEISDRDIAEKVANDYLDVSPVPHIADETYDADRDAHVVEKLAGFRDIAVVATGAVEGNEIEMGANPAITALAANQPAAADALGAEVATMAAETAGDDADGADDSSDDADADDDADTDADDGRAFVLADDADGLTAALYDSVTDPTDGRNRKSIKDGAMAFNADSSLAQDILRTGRHRPPSATDDRDVPTESVTDQILGDDTETEVHTVPRFRPTDD